MTDLIINDPHATRKLAIKFSRAIRDANESDYDYLAAENSVKLQITCVNFLPNTATIASDDAPLCCVSGQRAWLPCKCESCGAVHCLGCSGKTSILTLPPPPMFKKPTSMCPRCFVYGKQERLDEKLSLRGLATCALCSTQVHKRAFVTHLENECAVICAACPDAGSIKLREFQAHLDGACVIGETFPCGAQTCDFVGKIELLKSHRLDCHHILKGKITDLEATVTRYDSAMNCILEIVHAARVNPF